MLNVSFCETGKKPFNKFLEESKLLLSATKNVILFQTSHKHTYLNIHIYNNANVLFSGSASTFSIANTYRKLLLSKYK